MGIRWFTSDIHAGHLFAAQQRGFSSTQEHNAEIERRWNERVQKEDTVFILGDVALNNVYETIKLYERLNGTLHLIAGNHDAVWPGHTDAWKHLPLYLKYFQTVQPFMRIHMRGRTVLLSHFPYEADSTSPPRFTQYRLRDIGSSHWLLHGHLHSSVRVTSKREIHVGIDAWDLCPVQESDILELMRQQRINRGEER